MGPTLSWTASSSASSYDVYFGTSTPPPMVTTVTSNSYTPSTLTPGLTYYWMVVAKNSSSDTESSPIWSFTTTNATTVSVSPNTGSGNTQTFTLQYSNTAGAGSLAEVWVYFNATLASPAVNACMLRYIASANHHQLC